jgi:VanZ family protein
MHDAPPPDSDRFKRIAARARTLAIVYFILLFIGTHIPPAGIGGPSFSDKWAHFSGYLLLTTLVLAGWELTTGTLHPRHYFAVWLAGVVYGAFDEWTQIPVWRTCDMSDWAADVLGVTMGVVVYQLLRPLLFAVTGHRDGNQ